VDVPGRVAVAGFGGVPDGADVAPTLTTIALPLHEMARQAVDWVLEGRAVRDAEGSADADGADEIHVRGEVQLRESTALAPATA
jgi:LacI family transcriptional regulator